MKKVKNTESKNKDQLNVVAEASKPNAKPKNKVKKVKVAKETIREEAKPKPVTENGATAAQPEKDDGAGTVVKVEKKKAKKLAQQLKKKENKAKGDKEEAKEAPAKQENKAKGAAKAATKGATKEDVKEASATVDTTPLNKDKKQKQKKNKAAKPEAEKKATVAQASTKEPKLIERKKQRAEKKLKEKEERKQLSGDYQRDPAVTAATVFVGNVPVNTKRVQLVKLFADYGPISALRFRTAGGKVIFKHKHRTEAGSLNAYVVLKDEETATRALALNGTEFKGNHLRVTRADMNSQNRGEGDAKRMIFVGNLKYSATEEKLREIFSSCGDIEYVRCLRDGEKGCKGVSYVCFKSPEGVGLALELNETMLDERPIHVERYSVKKQGAKQARDASGEADKKKSPKTGAKKRLDDKNKKHPKKSGGGAGGKPSPKRNDDAPKKKGEFRGVKAGGVQKPIHKKKKPTSEMQQLAKKIAPKAV